MNQFDTSSRLDLEESIRVEFERLTTSTPRLASLVRSLLAQERVVVFGGFVRDKIHNHIHRDKRHSRDIDLVLCGTLKDSPDEALKNNFGGHRRRINGDLKVDYWELERTYAFDRGLFEPKLENLALTTVYTLNACFFDLVDGRLVEHQAVRDITNKTIAFNCADYLDVFPEYQAFRAMDLADRLGYDLDRKVQTFVSRRIDQSTAEEFFRAVQKHRREITRKEIGKLCMKYSK